MSKLILMMGIPGSGKSTWIMENMKQNDVWISRDKIRFHLIKEDEPYFSKEKQVFNQFVTSINECLDGNFDTVFADATHLNMASRRKILNKLKTKPDIISTIFIDVPLEVAIKRNDYRKGRENVPHDAIKQMYDSIELPIKEEGIDFLGTVDENNQIEWKELK